MTAVLWACRSRVPVEGRTTFCTGFRYLEPGTDPGLCGHVVVQHVGDGQPPIERTCAYPMDMIGEFELEAV